MDQIDLSKLKNLDLPSRFFAYFHDTEFKFRSRLICLFNLGFLCKVFNFNSQVSIKHEYNELIDKIETALENRGSSSSPAQECPDSIKRNIKSLEDKIIEVFFSQLNLNEEEYNSLISRLESCTKDTLLVKFKVAIYFHCFKETERWILLKEAWNEYTKPIVELIFGYSKNKYIKRFIFTHKTGNSRRNLINSKHLKDIIVVLFENSKNFKFFTKAANAYEILRSYNENRPDSSRIDPHDLNLTFTKSRNKKNNENQELDTNRTITITPYGITCETCRKRRSDCENINIANQPKEIPCEVCRNDRLVLIGKHEFSDIRLPSHDSKASSLSAAIFYKNDTYFIIDLSKSSFTERKLKFKKEYDIKVDMIINVAEEHLLRVVNIERDARFYNHSILTYEFIKGYYSKVIGNDDSCRKYCFESKTKPDDSDESSFLFGRGATNLEADFLLSSSAKCNQRVSKRQLFCNFKKRNREWYFYDSLSANGNFLLLKDYHQVMAHTFSEPQVLLKDFSGFQNENSRQKESEVFVIEGHTYYISANQPS